MGVDEGEIEIILQKAKEKYTGTSPRGPISDNGPQFALLIQLQTNT